MKSLLLTILLLVLQQFLSSRERVWLGAIIPAFYVLIIGILLKTGELELTYNRDIILLILGLVIFLSIWEEGRSSLKKKRKKELEKIESHDIK